MKSALLDFLEKCIDGIVVTQKNGFVIYTYDEFVENIVPTIRKVDYISCDLAIVIVKSGLGLMVEAL